MKNLIHQSSFQEVFPEFNQLIQSYGYAPIREITDLRGDEWLDLSHFLLDRGYRPEWYIAKWIGLDLRSAQSH